MKTKTAVPETVAKQVEVVGAGNSESCSVKETVITANSLIKTLNKAIEKDNVSFSKMTKMQKRVALAKDVIASINARQYNVTKGTYLNIGGSTGFNFNDKSSLLIKNGQTECTVCAIGSLFVSRLKNSNSIKLTGNDDKMIASMADVYDENELRTLEMLFEGYNVDSSDDLDKLENKCEEFYNKYEFDEDRLLSMMKNIIKNEGVFKYKNVKV